MVPLGAKEDVARIVDYQRFYKPKMKEFVKGFEYEYVQLSFKEVLVDLPDLDSEGKKPRCIYYENWCKAVWGAPWSVMRLSILKQLMKKDKVRAKKKLSTKYLKTLLEKQALAFNWRGLHVVVFPKKTIQRDDTEIIVPHQVYINGVEQTLVESKEESKLYRKLFTIKFYEGLDWRYLLDLNSQEMPEGVGMLWRYFEGVYTKDEEQFEKIGTNFMTGGPENPPGKKSGAPRGHYAERKRKLKEAKYADVDYSMGVTRYKNKSDEELSGHVLEARELAKVKRIERIIQEERKAAIKAQKQAERTLSDDRNRQKMELQAMVCIQNQKTKEVLRVAQYASVKYVSTGEWIYVEKYMWKGIERPDAKKNPPNTSGISRRMKRSRKPKKRPGFKFIQHKKKAKDYETELHEGEEYYVEKPELDMWPESEYEYIPVVYGKHHAKAGQPYMIFGWDDEGNKILKQAVRRKLKQVLDVARNIYIGSKLVKVEKWKRVVKK